MCASYDFAVVVVVVVVDDSVIEHAVCLLMNNECNESINSGMYKNAPENTSFVVVSPSPPQIIFVNILERTVGGETIAPNNRNKVGR